jgi:hypothetical protein
LNDVSRQILDDSSDNSSDESDSDVDSRVDHTYNPRCFKKLEKAIFKRPTSSKAKEEIKTSEPM